MTISEFDRLIAKAESAVAENKDPKTALIFLHKLLDLTEGAAFYAMFTGLSPDKRIVLTNIRSEINERAKQILGFIQDIVREESRK